MVFIKYRHEFDEFAAVAANQQERESRRISLYKRHPNKF